MNRPVLEAVADENSDASCTVCMVDIEKERQFMTGKLLKVYIPNLGFAGVHKLTFFTSMIDEKLDRKAGGLKGSSKYLCTLFDATHSSARNELGSSKYQEHWLAFVTLLRRGT